MVRWGWVRPLDRERTAEDGLNFYPTFSQDVDMPRIAKMARQAQPGLLVVDRTVHGPYENYRTPEQKIPKTQLQDPWETCVTLTKGWGYRKPEDEKVKSATWIIHTLAEIVAKGGNMLLGFGPTPTGEFPKEVEAPLAEVGKWLEKNGDAIYNTRITSKYNDGINWFTKSKDGKTTYAIICLKEGEVVPKFVKWRENLPAKGSKIRLLSTGKEMKWKLEGGEVKLEVPKEFIGKKELALAFSY